MAVVRYLRYFNMTDLATSVSWQGSHTQAVVAAMVGVRLSKPLRDDHSVSYRCERMYVCVMGIQLSVG